MPSGLMQGLLFPRSLVSAPAGFGCEYTDAALTGGQDRLGNAVDDAGPGSGG